MVSAHHQYLDPPSITLDMYKSTFAFKSFMKNGVIFESLNLLKAKSNILRWAMYNLELLCIFCIMSDGFGPTDCEEQVQ